MFKIIEGFLGWVLDAIIGVLNFPQLPSELVDAVSATLEYMAAGLGILNWFCPIALILPAIHMFSTVWIVKHGYDMIMWILGKIPMLSIR